MSGALPAATHPPRAAIRALGAGLIDYAGLFPPAELPMATAVANYAAYRRGAASWLLGRFVLPVARLGEFERALATLAATAQTAASAINGAADASDTAPWRLSALVATQPDHLATDLDQIARFNARHASGAEVDGAQTPKPSAIIDMLETKAQTEGEIAAIARTLAEWRDAPPNLTTYVELPLGGATPQLIARMAETGLRAKVRTGGVTADAFPSAAALAAFLRACVEAEVPFKATAGLHHAIRATYPLTYAPDSPCAPMYGFLNVVLATAFLADRRSDADVEAALMETDSSAFDIDAHVTWRGRQLTAARLAQARRLCVVSYGSCSFEEPLADLKTLGLL